MRGPDVSTPGRPRGGEILEGDPKQPCEESGRVQPPAPRRCHPQADPGARIFRPLMRAPPGLPPKDPRRSPGPGPPSAATKGQRARRPLGARPPAGLRGTPLPSRAHSDAAATLSSGGASGSRTALCLSSVMLGDTGTMSLQASSTAAGAGSSVRARVDCAGPAPPRLSRLQDPPQPGLSLWKSAPPSAAAAALSPGRSTVGLPQHPPASSSPEEGPGESAHAHRRHYGPRDPPMARIRQEGGGGGGGAERSGEVCIGLAA